MSNCSACDNLREYANDFLNNGVTEKICKNLQENNGINPDLSVQHNNCEDLHDINDCLIGALGDTLESYDVCDLKEFLGAFMNNLHTVIEAMMCSDCGQWTKIEQLIKQMNDVSDALAKILQKLKDIGVWVQEGDTIFKGNFASGKGIAGGNINLFGGATDGSSWIRTNAGSTENDLAGGVN